MKCTAFLASACALAITAALLPSLSFSEEAGAPAKKEGAEKAASNPAASEAAAAGAKEPEKKYPPQDPSLGAIEGRITLEGDPPQQKPLDIAENNKDHAHCAAHAKDERLVISAAKQVKDAVVSVAGYKPPSKVEPREVSIDNKDCTFIPRVQAATIGSKLKITSSDPFLHNTHGFMGAAFNKAVSKGDELVQKLLKQGPVLLKCDLHPWMEAWIQVFPHDLFDTSSADGTYRLVNVPPGEHEIEVWHQFLEAPRQKVKVEAGKLVRVDFAVGAKGKKK